MLHQIVHTMLDTVRTSKVKLIAIALSLFGLSAFAEAPKRVVSVNLCTDQLAMMVADPEQLISISYLARDPMSSAMAYEAKQFGSNHSQIEEIVALKPDMVLTHQWTSPFLISMLERFDIPYVQFASVDKLADIPAQYLQMGEVLGQREKAKKLANEFQDQLDALITGIVHVGVPLTVSSYGPNGWVGGGQSLGADILATTGFNNTASKLSGDFGGYVPLETFVMERPDVVLTSQLWPASSRGESIMMHPAVIQSGLQASLISTDANWDCGNLNVLHAVKQMIDLRAQITKGHAS